MPGPTTEVLNDDIKQLSRDLATFREDIVREVASIRVSASKDTDALRAEFAEFRGEIRAEMRFFKWAAGTAVAGVIALAGMAYGIVWQASKLDSRLGAVEGDVKEVVAAVRDANKKATTFVVPAPAAPSDGALAPEPKKGE